MLKSWSSPSASSRTSQGKVWRVMTKHFNRPIGKTSGFCNFFFHLHQIGIFRQIFSENIKYTISKKKVIHLESSCSKPTDGRTRWQSWRGWQSTFMIALPKRLKGYLLFTGSSHVMGSEPQSSLILVCHIASHIQWAVVTDACETENVLPYPLISYPIFSYSILSLTALVLRRTLQ
jgi:hypothetical protein